jgi:hypothetical protein
MKSKTDDLPHLNGNGNSAQGSRVFESRAQLNLPKWEIVVELVFRDEGEIKPLRTIERQQVRDLNARFWNLKRLLGKRQLAEIFEIGFRLRCWHDLFASETSWEIWRDENIRIPRDAVTWLIRVWDNCERIKNSPRYPAVRFRSLDGTVFPSGSIGFDAITDTSKPHPQRKRYRATTEGKCSVCGSSFSSVRSDAITCSARCRKRALRSNWRIPSDSGVDVPDKQSGNQLPDLIGEASKRPAGRFYQNGQFDALSVTSPATGLAPSQGGGGA